MSGLLSRLLKPIGRPLWRRLQPRIAAVLHGDPRFQGMESRSAAADQAIREMRLQTNHVPVLDRKLTDAQADAPILDFRLDQLKRDVDQKYAADNYILKQTLYEMRSDQDSLGRQVNTIKQALGEGALGSGNIEGQFAQLRAAVGRLEGQYFQMRAGLAQLRDAQAQLQWRGSETEHSKLAQDWVLEEWMYLCPMDVNGKEFVRVGRKGDGGYVMIDDIANLRFALSFGVGTEISWDLELAEWGVHVLLYDHTIHDIPTQHPKIKFRRVGLGHADIGNAKRRLPDILDEEGIGATGDNVLKIDIEGNEWETLREIPTETLERFSQVLIELHGMSDYAEPDSHINRMYVLKKLHQTHQVVHLHANNWGIHKIIGGVPIPDVIEVTYASRKRYSFAPCTRTFPTSLDYPNNADRADIMITLPVSASSANGFLDSKTH
jgi:hypothetical protein